MTTGPLLLLRADGEHLAKTSFDGVRQVLTGRPDRARVLEISADGEKWISLFELYLSDEVTYDQFAGHV